MNRRLSRRMLVVVFVLLGPAGRATAGTIPFSVRVSIPPGHLWLAVC